MWEVYKCYWVMFLLPDWWDISLWLARTSKEMFILCPLVKRFIRQSVPLGNYVISFISSGQRATSFYKLRDWQTDCQTFSHRMFCTACSSFIPLWFTPRWSCLTLAFVLKSQKKSSEGSHWWEPRTGWPLSWSRDCRTDKKWAPWLSTYCITLCMYFTKCLTGTVLYYKVNVKRPVA